MPLAIHFADIAQAALRLQGHDVRIVDLARMAHEISVDPATFGFVNLDQPTLFGDGKASAIEDYARGLDKLVLRVRDLVCAQEAGALAPADFRLWRNFAVTSQRSGVGTRPETGSRTRPP